MSRREVWSRVSGPDSFFFGRGNAVLVGLAKPTLFHTIGGLIVLLLLTLITFGVFVFGYFIWLVLFGERVVTQVLVKAEPEGKDATRLTVTSKGKYGGEKPEYIETLEAWIQRVLLEDKAAAAVEAPPPSVPATDLLAQVREKLAPQQPTPSTDIPDQIRKLAELRDAGAISAEEFETKKRELLNRM